MSEAKYKKVTLLLLRADVQYKRVLSVILKPYQLTVLQFELMRILDKSGQIVGTKFIKDNLTNPDIAVSKALDELSIMGFIDRDRAISNRRKIEIKLTALGKSIILAIEKQSPESILLIELKNEELERLSQLLSKIIKGLE